MGSTITGTNAKHTLSSATLICNFNLISSSLSLSTKKKKKKEMASAFEALVSDRRYPFVIALFVLLVCVTLLLFTNNPFSSSTFSISDLLNSHSSISASDPKNNKNHHVVGNIIGLDYQMSAEDPIIDWKLCTFDGAVDYIPCLDNWKAIKELPSRRHMEHRERHCPNPTPRCLLPVPTAYKSPIPWPHSRDMIWFDNVPHPKLVEYKKDQNWVQKKDAYLVFPGGGTQFKRGVKSYVSFIEKILPSIRWGKHTRVILDVGCGVASFGGYLLEKDVLTMSFAPKDEHEAQIQLALERGIPATLAVIGTQKLPFPDNAYDAVHCARCRVHWDADGGKPLMELNRIIRPGGYFIWSATPVYLNNTRDHNIWNEMVILTKSICWKTVVKSVVSSSFGMVIYQKPLSNSCYKVRKVKVPALCDQNVTSQTSWYVPLDSCLHEIPERYSDPVNNGPKVWPERLISKPETFYLEPSGTKAEEIFYADTKNWSTLVSDTYFHSLAINWSSIRNVMDMNAGFGGFAAALIKEPLWVMNVVPINGPDTLPVIFDRGLIGLYHDWCEPFNTYPRTYDLLQSSFLFGNLSLRCDIVDVVVEMHRILRPGGWILVQDTMEMIESLAPIMHSLHWDTTLYEKQFLVGRKGFWRPTDEALGKSKP